MALVNQGGALRVVGGALGTGQACCCGGVCCQPNGECLSDYVTREQCENCSPPGFLNLCVHIFTLMCIDPETGIPSYPDCPPGYSSLPGQPSGTNTNGRCSKRIEVEDDQQCSCMDQLLSDFEVSQLPCFQMTGYERFCNSGATNAGICGTWVNSCDDCERAPCYISAFPNQSAFGEWPCREGNPCPEGCECDESGRCVPICGAACDGETPCPEGCECVEGVCQNPLP
jgi:hypothetical protein